MREDVLRSFYWKSLLTAESVIKELENRKIAPTKELSLIYKLAFAGLLRNKVRFQLQERLLTEAPKEKKLGFFTVSTQKDATEAEVLHLVTIRDEDGDYHECSEETLRTVMFNDFDRIVLKKETEESKQEEKKPALILPELEFDDDTADTKQEQRTEEVSVQADIDNTNDPNRLPVFLKDRKYPDDPPNKKFDNTFLYNRHDVKISYRGQEGTIHFYVYPLNYKISERSTDIMVIAESGEVCRAGVSRGIGSSVEVEFADILFVARGFFDDGEFHSQVNVLVEGVNVIENKLVKHPAKTRTSSIYVKTEFQGIKFNIFPARYKSNGEKGYCPSAIIMERNDTIEILTPTSECTFSIIGQDNKTVSIATYWMGSGDNPEFRYSIGDDDW